VRAYAADRLAEAGEEERTRAAHAAFFVTLAERAGPELRARDQVLWLNWLSAEHDNCAATLRFAIDTGDVRLALRMVGALMMFWMMRDYDAEAGEWAAAVRVIAGDTAPEGLRDAYALCQFMALMPSRPSEEFTGLASFYEELQRLLPLTEGTSHPLLAMGRLMAPLLTGDVDGARRGLTELADHPDPWLRAAEGMMRGQLELNDGHVDLAADALAAGWAAFEEIGDRSGMMLCLSGLADVAMARADPAEAIRLIEVGQPLGGLERGQPGRLGRVQPARVLDPDRRQHRLGHVQRVPDRRQWHEPDPVGQLAGQPARGLHRQPGLPGSARPGQGDQPRLAQQLAQPAQLVLASHEAGELSGQVGKILDDERRGPPPARPRQRLRFRLRLRRARCGPPLAAIRPGQARLPGRR
jgi:hypothetical protein